MERIKTSDTIAAQRERERIERDSIPTAVRKYGDLYLKTFGRKPLHPVQLRLLETGRGAAQYSGIFRDIVRFLYTQRLSQLAANDMVTMLHDYFVAVIRRYLRFKRAPTIKQISPTPTNVSEFISFTIYQEQTTGSSYWLTAEDRAAADHLIQHGGTKFVDPIIDAAREQLQQESTS